MNAADGFFRLDMHVHTTHSDASIKIPALIAKARKKGIGFAITDHNTITGVVEAYKIKRKTDIIIPGMELHSKEGPHFLLYFEELSELKRFHEKHVEPNIGADPFSRTKLTIKKIINIAEKEKCVLAAAHPSAKMWANLEKAMKKNKIDPKKLKRIDAAEALSGQMTKKENNKALILCERYNLGKVGGSDAHLISEFGKIITIAQAGNIEEFLQCIKHKETLVVGKESMIHKKAMSQVKSARTHLRYARPYLKGVNGRFREKLNKKINKLRTKTKHKK